MLKKIKKTCSENAGGGGKAGGRKSEKMGRRESGPKSRHSMWEVSKKVEKTCSENAGRGGRKGRREGRKGGRDGGMSTFTRQSW